MERLENPGIGRVWNVGTYVERLEKPWVECVCLGTSDVEKKIWASVDPLGPTMGAMVWLIVGALHSTLVG